jgi:hypothetical protein
MLLVLRVKKHSVEYIMCILSEGHILHMMKWNLTPGYANTQLGSEMIRQYVF